MPKNYPYVPADQLADGKVDPDLVADIVELTAFFDPEEWALISDVFNAFEIGQDEYTNSEEEFTIRDRICTECAGAIERRMRCLGEAYPFELDEGGDSIRYINEDSWGRICYLSALLLSHLPAITEVLEGTNLAPNAHETRLLRNWFQSCMGAAMAGYSGGNSWVFGFPRDDRTGFLTKLRQIWETIDDGRVIGDDHPNAGIAGDFNDDEVDVIAFRPRPDGLPGATIHFAQVATGKNWPTKSLIGHLQSVFLRQWFDVQPASQPEVHHLIPFILPGDDRVARLTQQLGHIQHRLLLPRYVEDGFRLVSDNDEIIVEGVSKFDDVSTWLEEYQADPSSKVEA